MDTPVVCATHGEAAALGAAIQAAWCWSNTHGEKESLKTLCERCVSVEESSETRPSRENVAAYQKVYEKYLQQLGDV
ncbi:hypothetical protein AAVH_41537 [Aphelenchoides avenae]|nr:hypothetical protein AAVH_41537 [Aphelenchus avenae]